MEFRERARGYAEITRPMNVTAASVLTFVGALVGGDVASHLPEVAAAVAATWLATAAGNTINDYFDREIDAVNEPDRPIPRGAVSPRGALAFSLAMFGLAILLAVTLPPLAIGIAVVNLAALLAYTEFLKPLPGAGNAVVAYLGGSTFLFGGAAVGNVEPAAVLFALAALSTLSREIIKDVEDVEGDREEGLNTLPIAVGKRRSLLVAAALLAVAITASPLPYLTGEFGIAYLVAVVPAVAVMGYAGVLSFRNPALGHRRLKYGMFLAAVAFVVGRAAEVWL
jgi:geranylgeranylglycerol-phosphate geranylgeranyltransferase